MKICKHLHRCTGAWISNPNCAKNGNLLSQKKFTGNTDAENWPRLDLSIEYCEWQQSMGIRQEYRLVAIHLADISTVVRGTKPLQHLMQAMAAIVALSPSSSCGLFLTQPTRPFRRTVPTLAR